MFGLFKRGESAPLKSLSGRGTVLMGRMEFACRLRAGSSGRVDVLLERATPLNGAMILVDYERGLAMDVSVLGTKGPDVSFRVERTHDLKGLVPARLGRAREVYNRR